ncbi:Tumor necrosis factor ligand superfamily member 10 [Bagarius yarrelli]|uniref:Tumor necrosis factor ligand superfamily member 10 n=1 Tax=Bagarius yarrelli TaxID=175774 RepID=A0A556VAE3_BAGYA|nr:Tumor necrosis factor ligand superfamily member 10 [Bagarius yarrelli]
MGEVFVMDSQATVTPVPAMQRIQGTYVLYVLLGLALFGVLVEGLFIYRLYQKTSTPQASALGVIQWSDFGFPAFSRGFSYSNGSLIIHTEGFYFLFSKVSFTCSTFQHEVKLNSERYSYEPIRLMVDNRRSLVNQMKPHEKIQFSSYLGGVWLLHKKDEVFVAVDTRCLAEEQGENFFGGFMI